MTVFEPHWVQRPSTLVRVVHRVDAIDGALTLIGEQSDIPRRLVAGGTDVTVELDRHSGPDCELVDVSAIPGFRDIAISSDGNEVVLAGGVTHNDVVGHAELRSLARPLAQACLEIGSPQLRNRATLAGNLVTASPANDSISALMALDARLDLASTGPEGRVVRSVPVAEFFTGFRSTVLAPNEMVVAIRVPINPRAEGVWAKLGLRAAQAISVVHAGVVVELDGASDERIVVDVRLALGSVAETVVIVDEVREVLVGQPLTADSIEAAAAAASGAVSPIDDGRATAEYRRSGVELIVRRCLGSIAAGDAATRWPSRVPTLGVCRPSPRTQRIDDSREIEVTVNGRTVRRSGAASATLLDWVRDAVGTGTKEGCAEGECGACTVIADGGAVMSCLTPAAQLDGGEVTTVEGLAPDGSLAPMQQSFVDRFAVQCGYCIPGFIVAASALHDEMSSPTRADVELALSGNVCRCTGYYSIIDAVTDAFAAEVGTR